MPCHLMDNIIDTSVDKDILNSALDLGYSYFLSKKSICGLKVRDVFDGNDVLCRITREGKSPIETSAELKAFIAQHIEYLREHHSIEQDKPLFPGYYGISGEKQLRRHMKYSKYRDFHALINESYNNAYKTLSDSGLGFDECLSEIARNAGKSPRAIRISLYDRFKAKELTQKKRKPQAHQSEESPDEVTEEAQKEEGRPATPQPQSRTEWKPVKSKSYLDLLREAVAEHKQTPEKSDPIEPF